MHPSSFYLPDFSQKNITQAHYTSQPHDFIRIKPDCWLHQMFKQWSCDKQTALPPTHQRIIITWRAMRYHSAHTQTIFLLNVRLKSLTQLHLLPGKYRFWNIRPSYFEAIQGRSTIIFVFHLIFCKWNSLLQLTKACWVHTREQKGNVALFILHKLCNMIFHLCYLTFFSLKDSLASHAVVHI